MVKIGYQFVKHVSIFFGIAWCSSGCAEEPAMYLDEHSSANVGVCNRDETRCIEDDVFKCQNGHLTLHDQCSLSNRTCHFVSGRARCIAQESFHTDTETVYETSPRNDVVDKEQESISENDSFDDEGTNVDEATDTDHGMDTVKETNSDFNDTEASQELESELNSDADRDSETSSHTPNSDENADIFETTDSDGSTDTSTVSSESICRDSEVMLLSDGIDCSSSSDDIDEDYCANNFCWNVNPTRQTSCYNDFELIACPPFPCESGELCLFFGQDAQYPENEQLFSCYSAGAILSNCSDTGNSDAEIVVAESLNGLHWCRTFAPEKTWEEAHDYCDSLNYGGHDDWRLPSYLEYTSVLDFGRVNPAVNPNHFFFEETFEFWTTHSLLLSPDEAGWKLNINYGHIVSVPKSDTAGALCVRGGNSNAVSPDRYHIFGKNGEEWCEDRVTGLQWQLIPTPNLAWSEALRHCEESPSQNGVEWRLPNINELTSILDHSRISPATDFPNSEEYEGSFWSSTTVVESEELGYVIDFTQGYIWSLDKNKTNLVRCVRGGP